MGIGDIKLAAGIGAYGGLHMVLLTSYISFVIGSIIGLFLIFVLKRSQKDTMPFGPSIVLAAYIVVFQTDAIWNFLIRF